jgi:hypothetical protein
VHRVFLSLYIYIYIYLVLVDITLAENRMGLEKPSASYASYANPDE